MHAITHAQDYLCGNIFTIGSGDLKQFVQNYEIFIGDSADYSELRVRQDSG